MTDTISTLTAENRRLRREVEAWKQRYRTDHGVVISPLTWMTDLTERAEKAEQERDDWKLAYVDLVDLRNTQADEVLAMVQKIGEQRAQQLAALREFAENVRDNWGVLTGQELYDEATRALLAPPAAEGDDASA